MTLAATQVPDAHASSLHALPRIPAPWRIAPATGSAAAVHVTHYTDPLCPWAYSFEPALRALESRYGDQLRFRTVMIGLVETVEQSLARGSSATGRAQSTLRFRRYGMPITPHVRERVIASAPACRLIKAASVQGEHLAEALLRLLRLAWFTTPLLLDEDEVLLELCKRVEGLDAQAAVDGIHDAAVLDAYERDRAETRAPSSIAVSLRRTARSDGPERYTAPTLVLTNEHRQEVVVPGFQPFEAIDVAVLNLDPRLTRLPAPEPLDALRAYPGGLTSQEVARVVADTTDLPDRQAIEAALTDLVGEGRARRTPVGDDALWTSTQEGEPQHAAH